jgi:cytochrome c oxidase assembly protein subunit 15
MTPYRQLTLLARTALLLCILVVVLGAYVRLSAAGLGCPDWPGCYGHVTPLGAAADAAESAARFGGQVVVVDKAWKEMVHRYAAGTLVLLVVVIAALAIQYRRQRLLPPGLALGLLALAVAQGLFGMLTVTWQLKPLIVTGHLLFGLATLSLLCWIVLTLARTSQQITFAGGPRAGGLAAGWALTALLVLVAQISLGGWTSSNYAATACPDLPTCQGAWLPDGDYGNGFVLWRGLGINYEGGVLEPSARVAIHFAHRIGAVIVTLLFLWVGRQGLRNARSVTVRRASIGVLAALALQLLIAFGMILRGFPLWLATAHNAGAALLLLATVTLLHAARTESGHEH